MGRSRALLLILVAGLLSVIAVYGAYAEQIEITYFYSGVDSVYEEIVRNFERENPDIKVNLIAGNQLNYGRGIDPIIVLVAGGTPPDVVVMELAGTCLSPAPAFSKTSFPTWTRTPNGRR